MSSQPAPGPPVLPLGHPNPATAGEVLAGAFQWAYVTNDFEVAKRRLDETLGVTWLQAIEAADPVSGRTRDGDATISMRVGLGTLGEGTMMIELIEAVSDPTGMFTALLEDAAAGSVVFHHHGVVVADRQRAAELLAPDGAGPIWTSEGPDGMLFDVFDLRPQLGHFIETVQIGTGATI